MTPAPSATAVTVEERAALVVRGGWVIEADDAHREPGWPVGALRGLGTLPPGPRLAIVGARGADPYGREIADRIARSAAARGVPVVSGGALGIDIAAHRGALDAGGQTVVVLGSGLDHLAPARNRRDFERAQRQGAVVSPFATALAPTPWTYPRRNPWIAALADATVVVQAKAKSGSLQTAQAALALGRPVWVVPGAWDNPLHAGCHALVAQGAQVLTGPDGWAQGWAVAAPTSGGGAAEVPPEGAALWRAATDEPRLLSELAAAAGVPVAEASLQATMLELDGWLRAAPGGRYARARPGAGGGGR
ncbi:MAG: DNA-protecting protein DprA [Myxococcales bacterium]|nr:DNA-protecting protein DprA [Myxococcales bacterium]